MMRSDLVAQIHIIANGEKVPADLLCAMVETESAGNQWAMRYEARWKWFVDPQKYATRNGVSYSTEKMLQQFSYSYLQVMGAVARELGFEGPLIQLCADGELGLKMGARKLKTLLDKYPIENDAIASYNAGLPFKTENGLYQNEQYIQKVLAFRASYV